jgi:hypothetical protein
MLTSFHLNAARWVGRKAIAIIIVRTRNASRVARMLNASHIVRTRNAFPAARPELQMPLVA